MLGCSTTLVLEMPRFGSWLNCAGLWYNFSTGNASFLGPGWIVVRCGTTLVLEMPRFGVSGWIVLGCSTTLVLEMSRLGSWLDCA